MKEITRKSNFELMRILSMIFIVLFHFTLHGGVYSSCDNKLLKGVLDILICMSLVHVNSYILITGYFQSESKFKQKKVWKLINQTWFYRLVIVLFLILTDRLVLSKVELLQETAIVNLTEYWYAKIFLIVYIISPYLNKLIKGFSKKEYKRFIIILFVLLSIMPFITNGLFYKNDGFGIVHFIFLYFVGGYLKKYPFKTKKSKSKIRLIYISTFFVCVLLNIILSDLLVKYYGINSITKAIGDIFINNKINYSNPIIIIQTISYFCFFGTLDIKSKLINKISETSFAVYLIHDNQLLKAYIYKFFKLGEKVTQFSYLFYLLGVVFAVFVAGCIIEKIRIIVFRKIYNMKFSEKIRTKYYSYIEKINI